MQAFNLMIQANKAQITYDKKWECSIHKGNDRELLHVNVSTQTHRIC